MARKPSLTDQTNAASHELFKAAVARLGQRTDPGTDRRHAVLVDGVALGDRQNEMRRPGTAFYEQTFSEANAVAHLAVKLGLDREGTVDVLRRLTPMPDAELTVNGTTVAFVEQTMVMDQQAHLLTLNVEALNTSIMSAEDPALRAHLERGMLIVRLNEIPVDYYATGLPVEVLVEEVIRFAQSRQEDTPAMKIDRSAFPVLGSMRAFGLFRVPGKTYSPVAPIVDHGRPGLLQNALAEQIRKKRTKAAGYPETCRPLWLLLDVDHHFGWRDDSNLARAFIEAETPLEFDRVIVQQTYAEPLIIEFPGA